MLAKIAIVLAAIVAIFVAVVASRPDDFTIQRSAVIAAPPAAVFEHVNDFHKWEPWSPWAKLDPNSKVSFSGPESGKDASFTWSGNNEVGEGTQTITESRAPELIHIHLVFVRPFEANSEVEFAFKPVAGGTEVTWTMNGTNNFIGKAISLFMDCDKMVGGQFEKGLASLKAIVETPAKA